MPVLVIPSSFILLKKSFLLATNTLDNSIGMLETVIENKAFLSLSMSLSSMAK